MQINETTLATVRASLQAIEMKARDHVEIMMWTKGQLLQNIHTGEHHSVMGTIPNHLKDLLPPTETTEGAAALGRLTKQAQSIAPRVLRLKKYGAIGTINWGDGDEEIDDLLEGDDAEKLKQVNLEYLAANALEQALTRGMIAGIAIPTENGEARTQPLGGYVEPLVDEDDMHHVWGIYQAWQPADVGSNKWNARIYNLETSELFEWRGLDSPTDIGHVPEPIPNAPMPVFEILQTDIDGRPLGEFQVALPLFKSDWSSQVRGDRAEEATAFSQLVIKGGTLGDAKQRGAARVIRLDPAGDAKYLDPPSLEQIHKHHDRKLERLRVDLSLPGGFLGAQTPSGEALREANQAYIATCKSLAKSVSSYLTQMVDRCAEITGVADAPPVTVVINREFERAQVVEQTVMLFREGLLAFDAAVRTISAYYPTWPSEQVEAFISMQREVIPPPPGPNDGAEETL